VTSKSIEQLPAMPDAAPSEKTDGTDDALAPSRGLKGGALSLNQYWAAKKGTSEVLSVKFHGKASRVKTTIEPAPITYQQINRTAGNEATRNQFYLKNGLAYVQMQSLEEEKKETVYRQSVLSTAGATKRELSMFGGKESPELWLTDKYGWQVSMKNSEFFLRLVETVTGMKPMPGAGSRMGWMPEEIWSLAEEVCEQPPWTT
jgi:hypothetical protein